MNRRGRIKVAFAAACAQGLAAAHRGLVHVDEAVETALCHALSPHELDALTAHVYRTAKHYGSAAVTEDESAFLLAHLPAAPAHIVVGGCGAGREILALARAGYDVEGFDPSLPLLAKARARGARVQRGSYEDWSSGSLVTGTADAVVLGSRSFSHVLTRSAQEHLLLHTRRSCNGPVLLSWVQVPKAELQTRARRVARRLVQRVATPSNDAERLRILWHAGVLRVVTEDDVAAVAHHTGYRVSVCDAPMGRAVLVPAHAPRVDVEHDLAMDLLSRGVAVTVVARGHSMARPGGLDDGTRVRVSPRSPFAVGDIVALVRDGHWLMHRVVAADEATVTLKGDACPHIDGVFARSEVLGRVERVDGVNVNARDRP